MMVEHRFQAEPQLFVYIKKAVTPPLKTSVLNGITFSLYSFHEYERAFRKNGLNGLQDYVKNTAWHRSKFAIFYFFVIMLFWVLSKGFIDRRLEKESQLALEHSRAEKRFHSVRKQADDLKNRNAYLKADARRFSEKIAADKIKHDRLEQSLRERDHKIYLAEQEKFRLEAEQKKRAEELEQAKQRLALAKAKFEEMKNDSQGVHALKQKIQKYAQQNQLLKTKLSDYQEQFSQQQSDRLQVEKKLQQARIKLRNAEQDKQQYARKINELHRRQENLNREIKQKEQEIADAQNNVIGLSQQAYRYQLERRQKEEKEAQLVKLQQELADSKQKNQKLAEDLLSHEQKFLHETAINKKRYRDEIFVLQQQQQVLSREIEQKEKAIGSAKNDIACLSQQAYGYQLERREKEKKEAQLAQLQQELATSQQENQRLAAYLSDREQEFLQEVEINKKQYIDEISALQQQQQQLEQEMASKEQAIADASNNITALKNQIEEHNQEKQAQLAQLQRELAMSQQENQRLAADLSDREQKFSQEEETFKRQYLDEISVLQWQQQRLKQEMAGKEQEIADARGNITALDENNQEKQAQLARLQRELAASQQENQRLAADLSDREQKFLQEVEVNKKQYLDEISVLKWQQQRLKQEMAGKEQEIADARGSIAVLDEHNRVKQAQLAQLQQERQKLTADLDAYEQKLQQKDSDVLHLNAEQNYLKQQLRKSQENEAKSEEAIRSLEEKLELRAKEANHFNKSLQEKENQVASMEAELRRKKKEMEEAENKYSSTIGQLQTQKQDLEKQLELLEQEQEDFIANFDADESKWKIKYDSEKKKVKRLTEEKRELQEQNQQLQQQSASGNTQPFKRDNVLDDFKNHGSWFISKPAPSDIKINSGRHHSQNFVQEVGMDMGEIARQYAFIESVTSCEYGAGQTGKMYLSAKQQGQFAYAEEKYALRIYDKDKGYGAEVLLAATTPCEAVVQVKMIQYLKPKYQSYHLNIKI
ncbi:hypothetical protein [Conchiformibius steedae]|uniref:hypothetical protein n=1 Tax=Conchiformibius steedae TaxID=153493 RepID=UPI000F5F8249|nr:hypothetical protein [Conchiformibius steedae]